MTVFKKAYVLLDAEARRKIPVVILFSILLSVFEAAGIGMVLPFIQALFSQDGVTTFPELDKVTDALGIDRAGQDLYVTLGFFVLVLFVLKNIAGIGFAYWQGRYFFQAEARLASRLMRRFLDMPYLHYTQINSSKLVQMVVGSTARFFSSFVMPGVMIFVDFMTFVMAVTMLLYLQFEIASIIITLFVSAGILLYGIVRPKMVRIGQQQLDVQTSIYQNLYQSLLGLKEVRVFQKAGYFQKTFDEDRMNMAQLRTSLNFYQMLPKYYLEIVMVLTIGVMIATVMSMEEGTHAIATLALFGAAGIRIMPLIGRIMSGLQNMKTGQPAIDQLYEEFAAEHDHAGAAYRTADGTVSNDVLRIDGVSFTYPDAKLAAVTDVTLTIKAGDSIGLVGLSGAGKSTLADMLLGLIHPESGHILYAGCDIHENIADWRRRIGYVPQSIYLTDDTLQRNIAFGMPDDDIDPDLVMKVVEMADLKDLVVNSPDGLDTQVGERGMKLSGGQRQRIGIARALYHQPDILILDEPTSGLDNETEKNISDMVHSLHGRVTLIVIAHRLMTIQHCDKVAFMKNGMIVDEGPFSGLVQSNEDFARFVNLSRLSEEVGQTGMGKCGVMK